MPIILFFFSQYNWFQSATMCVTPSPSLVIDVCHDRQGESWRFMEEQLICHANLEQKRHNFFIQFIFLKYFHSHFVTYTWLKIDGVFFCSSFACQICLSFVTAELSHFVRSSSAIVQGMVNYIWKHLNYY